MSEPPLKDRKKSAHWTDADTDTLVNVLLRYKDTGRTADNGFKPEVWREASNRLEGATVIGGPKTPEACKSRWQRLQRDFKAAKDLEALPGFSWDRQNHKLVASQEAWDAAEKQIDAYKYPKIHLPCYDALNVLCPIDNPRLRPRANKPRGSMTSISDSSSMLSLSVGSAAQPQTPQMTGMSGTASNTGMVPNGHMQGMDAMHIVDGSMMPWDNGNGEMEGDQVEFDGTFTMPDGTQHTFNMGQSQKRLPYDPNVLSNQSNQPHQSIDMTARPSPSKKPRTTPSNPTPHRPSTIPPHHAHHQMAYHIALPHSTPNGPSHSPDFSTAGHPIDPQILGSPTTPLTAMSVQQTQHQHHHQQQHQQHQQHSHPQQHPPPSHQTRQRHQPPHAPPRSAPSAPSHHAQPCFLPHPNQPPPTRPYLNSAPQPSSSQLQPAETSSSHSEHPPRTPINSSSRASSHAPIQSSTNPPTHPTSATTTTNTTNPTNTHGSAEVLAAGLSESQRRTEAILQLQAKEVDMRDEDMVEVMAEFETNVAAADTYLAIKRDGLRRLWLMKVVKRRKRAG